MLISVVKQQIDSTTDTDSDETVCYDYGIEIFSSSDSDSEVKMYNRFILSTKSAIFIYLFIYLFIYSI